MVSEPVQDLINKLDKNIKPYWYIDIEILIVILQVLKNLDEDLKRKIVKIITLKKKKQEEIQELRYNAYDEYF